MNDVWLGDLFNDRVIYFNRSRNWTLHCRWKHVVLTHMSTNGKSWSHTGYIGSSMRALWEVKDRWLEEALLALILGINID